MEGSNGPVQLLENRRILAHLSAFQSVEHADYYQDQISTVEHENVRHRFLVICQMLTKYIIKINIYNSSLILID